MKKSLLILFCVGVILFCGNALAYFTYFNDTINSQYSAGDTIGGTVSLSLLNEPASSMLTSSVDGNITILGLLKADGFSLINDYNCSTSNCVDSLSAQSQISQLNLGSKNLAGFSIGGNSVDQINSVSFHVESSSSPSCYRQIQIEPVASWIYITNNKYTNTACFSRNYGCFDSNAPQVDAFIGATDYCEQMTLPIGPAYKLSAKIQNSIAGSSTLKMQLKDSSENNLLGECVLPTVTQGVQEISCTVNYSSPIQSNYSVCVSGQTNSGYSIKTETISPTCGTGGRDYEIYAQPMEFDSVSMDVNDSTFQKITGESLSGAFMDYLQSVYGGTCSQSCVFPISFVGDSQTLTFSNVNIDYDSNGVELRDENLYKLSNQTTTVNSKILTISLAPASLTIPPTANGQINFMLYLGGNNVLPQVMPIQVSGNIFSFGLEPTSVLSGIETIFSIDSSYNITNAVWEFGDGSSSISQGKTISHRYLADGNYSVEITATRNDGSTSKQTFSVTASTSEDSLAYLLDKYSADLGNYSEQLGSLPSWISSAISSRANITQIGTSLTSLKEELSSARTENYTSIMQSISSLHVPHAISVSKTGTLPMEIGYSAIDTSYLETLSNSSVLSDKEKENLKSGIISWMQDNYNVSVGFKVYYAWEDKESYPLATVFDFYIEPLNENRTSGYLFVGYPENEIIFKNDYGAREISEPTSTGTAIPISGDEEHIEFLIPREISIEELGAYISPDMNTLSSAGKFSYATPPENRWPKATWWIILSLVGIFIIYIILQEWYKFRYQSFLFKKPNDLYNVINFIYNMRLGGMGDHEIESKLKGSGWSGESVSYAFKKIDGKRTGMFEIPVLRWWEQRKIRKEIEKRRQETRRKVY